MNMLLTLQYPVCTLSVYSFMKENKVTIKPKLRELIILQNNGRSQCIMSVNEFSESATFFKSLIVYGSVQLSVGSTCRLGPRRPRPTLKITT